MANKQITEFPEVMSVSLTDIFHITRGGEDKKIQAQNFLGDSVLIDDSNWNPVGLSLTVANGGTGASDESTARTNLGLEIGVDVQAFNADLSAISSLAKTDGNIIVANGSTWVAESGATARASLGLGPLAAASTISNTDWSGTDLSVANGGTGASTAEQARINLGISDGDYLRADNNLGEIANPATARTNLGLSTAATAIVQTSATDTTAGRLMTVGAFGLGAQTTGVLTDADALLNAGFYAAPAEWTGSPIAGVAVENQGYVVHQSWSDSASYALQTFYNVNMTYVNKWRRKDSGVWGPWVETLKQGDYGIGVTGATISNANTALVSSFNGGAGAGATNFPSPNTIYGPLLSLQRGVGVTTQLATWGDAVSPNEVWVRGTNTNGASWSTWTELLKQGDSPSFKYLNVLGDGTQVPPTGTNALTLNGSFGGGMALVDGTDQYSHWMQAGEFYAGFGATAGSPAVAYRFNAASFNFQMPVTVLDYNGTARRVGWNQALLSSVTGTLTLAHFNNSSLVTGNVTIPATSGNDGDMIHFKNKSGSSKTIAVSSGTLRWMNGGTSSTGTRTLANYGTATAQRNASGDWDVWGVGLT